MKTQAGLTRLNCPVSPRTSSDGADSHGDESTRTKEGYLPHGRISRQRQMEGSAQWEEDLPITTLNFQHLVIIKHKLILTLFFLHSLHTK